VAHDRSTPLAVGARAPPALTSGHPQLSTPTGVPANRAAPTLTQITPRETTAHHGSRRLDDLCGPVRLVRVVFGMVPRS